MVINIHLQLDCIVATGQILPRCIMSICAQTTGREGSVPTEFPKDRDSSLHHKTNLHLLNYNGNIENTWIDAHRFLARYAKTFL